MNAADAVIHALPQSSSVWGTLPGWIMAITSSGTLGVVLNFWLRQKKLKLDENADDRAGFGVLIKALQEDIALVRAEHRKCEDRLSKIEGELMGFHRQALIASQQGLASLPATTMVRDAADRAVQAADAAFKKHEDGAP